MNIRVVITVAMLFVGARAWADFEEMGSAARPWGMANAYTALATDYLALVYNPAGLSTLGWPEAGLEYNRLWVGLSDQSNIGSHQVSFAMPFRTISAAVPGGLGFGYANTYLAGIYAEQFLTLGYGVEVEPGYAVGFALKYLTSSITVDSYLVSDPIFIKTGISSGVAADLGFMMRAFPSWSFGWVLQNILSPNLALKGTDAPPTRIKGGAAYRIPGWDFSGDVVLEGGDLTFALGMEKRFSDRMYFIRGGFIWGAREYRVVTLGTGLNLRSLQFDYAFLLPMTGPIGAGSTHRVSMVVRFGNPMTQSEIEFQSQHLVSKEMYDEQLSKLRKELEQAASEVDRMQKERNDDRAMLDRAVKMMMELSEKLDLVEKEAKKVRVVERIVERQPPPPPKPVRPSSYIVKEGDTLKSIAKTLYDDEEKWVDLFKSNQEKIRQGMVVPGQVLVVP